MLLGVSQRHRNEKEAMADAFKRREASYKKALAQLRRDARHQSAALENLAGVVDALNEAAESPSATDEEVGARVRQQLRALERRSEQARKQLDLYSNSKAGPH